jgi:hypothetical protein
VSGIALRAPSPYYVIVLYCTAITSNISVDFYCMPLRMIKSQQMAVFAAKKLELACLLSINFSQPCLIHRRPSIARTSSLDSSSELRKAGVRIWISLKLTPQLNFLAFTMSTGCRNSSTRATFSPSRDKNEFATHCTVLLHNAS